MLENLDMWELVLISIYGQLFLEMVNGPILHLIDNIIDNISENMYMIKI